jgi:hypothetical protein
MHRPRSPVLPSPFALLAWACARTHVDGTILSDAEVDLAAFEQASVVLEMWFKRGLDGLQSSWSGRGSRCVDGDALRSEETKPAKEAVAVAEVFLQQNAMSLVEDEV